MYYNNKRLALSIMWIVLGAVLLVLSFAEVLDASSYAGMGGALMAVGALQVVKNVRYRSNPLYREQIDTQLTDERIEYLRMKSWSWAGVAIVIGEAIASVIAMVLGNETLQLAFSYNVCLMLVVYFVCYAIVSRKY